MTTPTDHDLDQLLRTLMATAITESPAALTVDEVRTQMVRLAQPQSAFRRSPVLAIRALAIVASVLGTILFANRSTTSEDQGLSPANQPSPFAGWESVPTPTAIPSTWKLIDVRIELSAPDYQVGALPGQLFRRAADGAALLIETSYEDLPQGTVDSPLTTWIAAPVVGDSGPPPASDRTNVVVGGGSAIFTEGGTDFTVETAGMNDADATTLVRGLTRPAMTPLPNFEAPTELGVVLESTSPGQAASTEFSSASRTYLIGPDRGVSFFIAPAITANQPQQRFGVPKPVDGVTLFVRGNSIHREPLDGFVISATVVNEQDRAEIERALASTLALPLGVWENERNQLSLKYAMLPADLAVDLGGRTVLRSHLDGPIVALCVENGDVAWCRASLTVDFGGGSTTAAWGDIPSSAGWVSAAQFEGIADSAVFTSTTGTVITGRLVTGHGYTLAGVVLPDDSVPGTFDVSGDEMSWGFTPVPPLL